jgi:hypothetical protein
VVGAGASVAAGAQAARIIEKTTRTARTLNKDSFFTFLSPFEIVWFVAKT